jgi:hypothetical protein
VMQWHMYLASDPQRLIAIEFGKPQDYEARQAMIEAIEEWLKDENFGKH